MSNENQWAWLGLLKWSLAYSDGTAPSDESLQQMSAADRAFLETVMKEGIMDENERMKVILKDTTQIMEQWKSSPISEKDAEIVEDLLQELRDIVEQIDYARAFCSLKGLPFVLGIIQEESFPRSTRMMGCGLIATLCQHNPPVQKELLELGSLKLLSEMLFTLTSANDTDGQFRARIVQAVSANVRSNELAEAVFAKLKQSKPFFECTLFDFPDTPTVVRRRALFFFRAFLTADGSDKERIEKFNSVIAHVIDSILLHSPVVDKDLVEMALALVEQLLVDKKSIGAVLSRKPVLVAAAVPRVAELRQSTDDNNEVELRHWEAILTLLAATP